MNDLVASTLRSVPANNGTSISTILATELPATLTTPTVVAPQSEAAINASMTSAVSPLWLNATTTSFDLIVCPRSSISDAAMATASKAHPPYTARSTANNAA